MRGSTDIKTEKVVFSHYLATSEDFQKIEKGSDTILELQSAGYRIGGGDVTELKSGITLHVSAQQVIQVDAYLFNGKDTVQFSCKGSEQGQRR